MGGDHLFHTLWNPDISKSDLGGGGLFKKQKMAQVEICGY
tara:strand:- start:168 stop:287 length:120 start_codon:yes stop_codon:yes gene_type:complete